KAGVEFIEGEPGAGIVGASGLLLGLGKLRGIEGGCLMGETSGYMVDPKSAQALLVTLQKLLGIKIDLTELEKRAEQVDEITTQLREMESESPDEKQDFNYIG
ncbi:MAG: PAC2 family protein, partial [Candidatus Poseidoniia archaeon]